jgi:hypothetical protein
MDKTTVFPMIGFLLAFLGLGVAYFAIYLGIRHDRYKRELEHKERMRALELGRSLPGDIPWLSTQRIGFLIGVVVPVTIFAFAGVSTQASYQPGIWEVAGSVSAVAILAGTVVVCVGRHVRHDGPCAPVEKLPVEDDAYDVVSARG